MDKKKILQFWNKQANKISRLRMEGVANLEEDPEKLKYKIKLETKKIFHFINFKSNKNIILDLGSGTGHWALKFSPYASKIVAVEYSKKMLDISVQEANKNKIKNISFVNIAAQAYYENITFDFIFISGLLIYLNDRDIKLMLNNLKKMSRKGTILILRDGTSVYERYEIKNKYSEILKLNYSATYRTVNEYISFFNDYGFKIRKYSDMFPKNSMLNKWKETRLRIFKFTYE